MRSVLLISAVHFEHIGELALKVLLHRPGTRQQLAPRLPTPERVGILFSRFPGFCAGGFIAWAVQVWRRRRERSDLAPDAQILVRFCELGLKFSLLGTAVSLILLPMYATGPGKAAGFNVLCLSNLKVGGSIRFWCVILAAYMLTSAFGYLVLSEWRIFSELRRSHFASAASGSRGPVAAQSCRTLMVQEVPLHRWSERDWLVVFNLVIICYYIFVKYVLFNSYFFEEMFGYYWYFQLYLG